MWSTNDGNKRFSCDVFQKNYGDYEDTSQENRLLSSFVDHMSKEEQSYRKFQISR